MKTKLRHNSLARYSDRPTICGQPTQQGTPCRNKTIGCFLLPEVYVPGDHDVCIAHHPRIRRLSDVPGYWPGHSAANNSSQRAPEHSTQWWPGTSTSQRSSHSSAAEDA
jgi:hypothetical protein